jgi:hypothetical protein
MNSIEGPESRIELRHEFTPKARELLTQEGVVNHAFPSMPYPALPVAGDLISYDWLCDGRLFTVQSRLFIWESAERLVVQLLLDA